jgi:hypothetical protein
MRRFLPLFGFLFLSHTLAPRADAQQAGTMALPLTHSEQAHTLGEVTKSERLTWMREQVRESRYGQKGLNNLFKNFEGNHFIDSDIPGVSKNLRFLSSPSASQAIGARRNLLFGTKLANDSRFKLVALDKPHTIWSKEQGRWLKTDQDQIFKVRQTGQSCWVEVKDVKPAGQRSDFQRIKQQIDNMAAENKRSGTLTAWVNRQETIPAIKDYAKQKGVPVYEKTKQAEFPRVLEDLKRRSLGETRMKFAGGALNSAIGILLLYTSGEALLADLKSNSDDFASRLKIGEHASLLVSGGASTAYSIAEIASRFTTTGSTLVGLGKWGGPTAFAGFIVAEGIGITLDVMHWEKMSEGQKSVAWIRHGSNALLIFVTFPGNPLSKNPWVAIPLLAAGGAGHVVAYLVEKYYAALEEEQKCQVRDYIYKAYGVSP